MSLMRIPRIPDSKETLVGKLLYVTDTYTYHVYQTQKRHWLENFVMSLIRLPRIPDSEKTLVGKLRYVIDTYTTYTRLKKDIAWKTLLCH